MFFWAEQILITVPLKKWFEQRKQNYISNNPLKSQNDKKVEDYSYLM